MKHATIAPMEILSLSFCHCPLVSWNPRAPFWCLWASNVQSCRMFWHVCLEWCCVEHPGLCQKPNVKTSRIAHVSVANHNNSSPLSKRTIESSLQLCSCFDAVVMFTLIMLTFLTLMSRFFLPQHAANLQSQQDWIKIIPCSCFEMLAFLCWWREGNLPEKTQAAFVQLPSKVCFEFVFVHCDDNNMSKLLLFVWLHVSSHCSLQHTCTKQVLWMLGTNSKMVVVSFISLWGCTFLCRQATVE